MYTPFVTVSALPVKLPVTLPITVIVAVPDKFSAGIIPFTPSTSIVLSSPTNVPLNAAASTLPVIVVFPVTSKLPSIFYFANR